jgi:hypothetical protein
MTRRRLLKYLGIGLFTLALGALWAFSYFFFNPLEGRFGFHLATLIPRDVDFYVAKAGLADDLEPFPRPAFADELEADPHGRALLELAFVKDLLARIDLAPVLGELEANLARLPIRREPLDIFGGTDVAVAGNLSGADLAAADWAVYGRVDWVGKLGFELLNSGLVPLESQGIALGHVGHGVSLAGGELPRTLYLTRLRDVVVVATREDYLDEAHALDNLRGENSFGLSAKYADHLAQLAEGERDCEAFVDWHSLAQPLSIPDAWPPPGSPSFAQAFAGRLFQVGALREAFARLSFANGVVLDLSGEFNSENVSSVQKRVYREQGLEKAEVKELASLAPADVGFFLSARLPLRELLTAASESLDEATRGLVVDQVRAVWGHPDLAPLIEDIGGAFQNRFAFFLRDNDYPEDTGADAPLHDDAPTSAWALALLVDDPALVEALRNRVHSNPAAFGIAGRDPAKGGIFYNEVAGGAQIIEYHNPNVPGTGLIATLEARGKAGTFIVIGNSHLLLGQVNVTYLGQQKSLAGEAWFETLVNTGLPSADVVVWSNPRAITRTTHAVARRDAELDLTLFIDWEVERPRIERKVKQEQFSGVVETQADHEAFDLAVEEEINRFQAQFAAERLPAIQADYLRPYDALELMSRGFLELTIDPKGFRLHGRAVVPFDAEEASVAQP